MSHRQQQGFTLIELLVVVVIVAVLLSVTVLSVKPNEAAKVRQQTQAFKGLLLAMCDQAAFQQTLFLLMPSESGLSVAKWQAKTWQASERFMDQAWLQGIEMDWMVDVELAKQQQWPAAGWMCWPSGEVMAGQIRFKLGEAQTELSWDPLLRFEQQNKQVEP